YDLLELLQGPASISHLKQRRPQLVPQRRVGWRQLEPLAKQRGRRRPTSNVERSSSPEVVRHRTLQQFVQFLHQRILRENRAVPLLPQLRLSLSQLTQPAVGHGERIMDVRSPRTQRRCFLQVLRGPGVVFFCESRASRAEPCSN